MIKKQKKDNYASAPIEAHKASPSLMPDGNRDYSVAVAGCFRFFFLVTLSGST